VKDVESHHEWWATRPASEKGGQAEKGSKYAEVNMATVNFEFEDDPSTGVDERAMVTANIGVHEAGHASSAKLDHPATSDGSVMQATVPGNATTTRLDFNNSDSRKLKEAYNK
jgi:hypothetical protein